MLPKLQGMITSPVVIAGLAMTFAGLYYKLAVFPFHFWTPDVYQGASNETASLIASLPKVGAVAVLVRLVSLATPQNDRVAMLLAMLAVASWAFLESRTQATRCSDLSRSTALDTPRRFTTSLATCSWCSPASSSYAKCRKTA
jgi:NADH:ubiquinone oxidoreductase subunit 4 (subunit M)